jgi:hypothetical protein
MQTPTDNPKFVRVHKFKNLDALVLILGMRVAILFYRITLQLILIDIFYTGFLLLSSSLLSLAQTLPSTAA